MDMQYIRRSHDDHTHLPNTGTPYATLAVLVAAAVFLDTACATRVLEATAVAPVGAAASMRDPTGHAQRAC